MLLDVPRNHVLWNEEGLTPYTPPSQQVSRYISKTCPCYIQKKMFDCKNENVQCTNFDFFLTFAQNIERGPVQVRTASARRF